MESNPLVEVLLCRAIIPIIQCILTLNLPQHSLQTNNLKPEEYFGKVHKHTIL